MDTTHQAIILICIFQVDILLKWNLLWSPGLIPRAMIFISNIKIDPFLNPFALRNHT